MINLTERAAREVSTIISQQKEPMRDRIAKLTDELAQANSPERKHEVESELEKLRQEEASPFYLRVGVKGGGCSGFNYTLDLTEKMSEMDEEWDIHGVKVICDPKSHIYLEGVAIDFKDEVMGRGFTFNNPNATHTCGCGSSFSA